MSIEQQYYENEAFWVDEMFTSQGARFNQIASHIPPNARSVLDVGCGNGAFVHLLSSMPGRFDTIHATDRSAAALRHVRTQKTEASLDALPFEDRSFDIVTSLEVIEHLPATVFDAGLSNICRIAKDYVLLSVPHREDLEASFIPCPACRTRFNPDYHMRSFDEARMKSLLRPFGFEASETFFIGPFNRYFVVSSLREAMARMKPRTNPFSMAIPCPVCGTSIPPGVDSTPAAGAAPAAAAVDTSAGSGVKALVKRMLHKRTDYAWVAALYRRV